MMMVGIRYCANYTGFKLAKVTLPEFADYTPTCKRWLGEAISSGIEGCVRG